MKLLTVALCFLCLALTSCASSNARNAMMLDGTFSINSLELVDNETEIVVAAPESLSKIQALLEVSPRLAEGSAEIHFAEMQKLRLLNSNSEKSRVYLVDLQNGYATILSKTVNPVYKIADLQKLKGIVKASGRPKPSAG